MPFVEEDLKAVTAGTKHAYIWGWSGYTDVFGCKHKTEFCTEITTYQKPRIFWNDCAEHNCADKNCKDYQPNDAPSCKE
jgi:hypothetical protein